MRAALEGVRLPVAVVSNSRLERVRASVRRAGLDEVVGARVFSAQQVERPKPYPDVYLLAAQRSMSRPSAVSSWKTASPG